MVKKVLQYWRQDEDEDGVGEDDSGDVLPIGEFLKIGHHWPLFLYFRLFNTAGNR